jgi:AcrR family transcriptional regulator
MSRRERMREATREEIKAVASRQMAESGTASLSLTAIARAMELVPSALYRYYPDRDALITALILDAFEDLAGALHSAERAVPTSDFRGRLHAASSVYRSWSLAHPIEFQLVFGNPIPGYEAPVELTGPAMANVFGVFMDVLQAAYAAGKLRPVPDFQPEAMLLPSPADQHFMPYSPPVMYSGLAGWTTMHGVVTLELFGFLPHTVGDRERFYKGRMDVYMASIGLGPP